MQRLRLLVLAATLAVPATASAGATSNGISLNGISLNGISLNGISLNGISLNGISLNGISLNGISLNGSELTAAGEIESSFESIQLAGADFIGAEIDAVASDGTPVTLRIDDIRAGADAMADVYYYTVSITADGAEWAPLCGSDDSGAAIEAVALAGRWSYEQGVTGGGDHIDDPDSATFGCVSAALGKCVNLGYKPWDTRTVCKGKTCEVLDMADFHQACTRMIRSDYCGDGTSYTKNGTPINLFDAYNIQKDAEPWALEALWNPDGAYCLYDGAGYDHYTRTGALPTCYEQLASSSCGSGTPLKDGEALLASEAQQGGDSLDTTSGGNHGGGPRSNTGANGCPDGGCHSDEN